MSLNSLNYLPLLAYLVMFCCMSALKTVDVRATEALQSVMSADFELAVSGVHVPCEGSPVAVELRMDSI